MLRHAALQLGLSRRGGAGGRRAPCDLFARSEHVVVPSGSCAWMVKDGVPGAPQARSPALRRRPRVAGRRARASCPSSSWRCSGVTRGRVELSRGRSPTTTPAICCAGSASRASPRALLRGVAGVELVELPGRGRVLRLRRLLLGAAARGLVGDPRQEARQRREATGADCLVACDAGCLMQMGGGLSRRGSRVRALHLAQVLAGRRRVSERRGAARRRFPSARARRSGHASCRKRSASPPPSSSTSAARPSRASRRARPCATGRAPSRRPRSSASTSTWSSSPTTSSGSAGTCTGRPPREEAREIVLRLCRDRGVRDGGEVQVDGHRGDRPQRGARARRGHAGRDRPRRVHHPARPREAVAHHRARHPQDQGAGGRALLARSSRAASPPTPRC